MLLPVLVHKHVEDVSHPIIQDINEDVKQYCTIQYLPLVTGFHHGLHATDYNYFSLSDYFTIHLSSFHSISLSIWMLWEKSFKSYQSLDKQHTLLSSYLAN